MSVELANIYEEIASNDSNSRESFPYLVKR